MDEIKTQLVQMKAALQLAEEDDKPGIQMIINQLEELIGGDEEEDSGGGDQAEEEETDEYKLFQAEIAALSGGGGDDADQSREEEVTSEEQPSTSHCDGDSKSIDEELEALIGMKCMAPHQESWGQIGYYSAMISSVLSLEGGEGVDDKPSDLSAIMVRLIFIQPVVKSQLLCPFYKDDRCRFSDEDCKFSHGEVVPLARLREYSEPDYTKIIPGSRVLAKYHDDLWYKATVHRITPDGECEISYDVGKESLTIPLHETTLLSEDTSDVDLSSDSSSSSEDDVENPNLSDSSSGELDIPKTLLGGGAFTSSSAELLDMKGTSTLGVWERYTKGIGSQLMLKMGYVMGTGLGRHREGRVEPVDAIVLPAGKSLDACMELKERAKDGNLFSAEKIRLKRQRKEQKQRERQAVQDKLKEKKASSVFEFLNDKLSLRKCNENGKRDKESANKLVEQLSKQNRESLNKRALGIHENLMQVSKEIQKTKESMKRNQKGKDMETYGWMEKKLGELEARKKHLDGLQSKVDRERRHRLDKRKLDLF